MATGYSAYAPDVPGCISGGFTFEEKAEFMPAIQMHLEVNARGWGPDT
jgi:predicted RNase H-like HicB family nuclease